MLLLKGGPASHLGVSPAHSHNTLSNDLCVVSEISKGHQVTGLKTKISAVSQTPAQPCQAPAHELGVPMDLEQAQHPPVQGLLKGVEAKPKLFPKQQN